VRGLAPLGYHVPTDAEWTILTTYLGGLSVAGGKMKATGTELWQPTNVNATNESGFTGLPGGLRYEGGLFAVINNQGIFYGATEFNPTTSRYYRLKNTDGILDFGNGSKGYGFSVRLIKD